MRQYVYKAAEAGISDWPSGTLRLEGIDVTENPAEADLFVIPGGLTTTETFPSSRVPLFQNRATLERLPYFTQHEEKHVAFDCSDNEFMYSTSAMFIRCNTRDWYLYTEPNTISWPWPVEPLSEYMALPDGGFKYDVSFQGWEWSDCRKAAIASCRATPNLKCDFATYTRFYGHLKDDVPEELAERLRRRKEFLRSMKESRIALCPESIPGVFPYRFFEAMSAGRVPLLIGSGYVLPFADQIPYDEFTVQIAAESASSAGDMVAFLVSKFSDDELQAKGEMAQRYYEQFLHRDKWPQLMALAVKQKLGVCV